MSSSTVQWTWDPTRKEYFYFSQAENVYIYQNGRRVRPAGPNADESSARPRSDASQQLDQRTSEYNSSRDRAQSSSAQYTTATAVDGIAQQMAAVGLTSASTSITQAYDNASTYAESSHSYATSPQTSHAVVESQVPRNFGLARTGRGFIRASEGDKDYEELDPNYRRRSPGHKFFVVGKVFRVLWPEVAGYAVSENLTVTSDGKFSQENYVTKIRWFVVVKKGDKGDNHALCLPILTYGNQGVAKPGTIKWKHAIAFTAKKDGEPGPDRTELAGTGEYGMMAPIRIKSRSRQEKLHKMSRINFSKIYTVEHNVKVYDFGDVYEEYLPRLKQQWRYVLDYDEAAGHPSDSPTSTRDSYAAQTYANPQTNASQQAYGSSTYAATPQTSYSSTQSYGTTPSYAVPQTHASQGTYQGYPQTTSQGYNTTTPDHDASARQGYSTSTVQGYGTSAAPYGTAPAHSYGTAPAHSYGTVPAQSYGPAAAQSYAPATAQSYGTAVTQPYSTTTNSAYYNQTAVTQQAHHHAQQEEEEEEEE